MNGDAISSNRDRDRIPGDFSRAAGYLRVYRTAPYDEGTGALAAAAEACCRRGVLEPERLVLAAFCCGAAAGCCDCGCCACCCCDCSVCGAACCACAN